jgi:glycosyltransferase involved in cell wall biosynthesis
MADVIFSVVVPVYRNEDSIGRLVAALVELDRALEGRLEAVFVVDGSPDRSFEKLRESLRATRLRAQLLAHSRNFGSFAAIRTGLAAARGRYFAVMAADLQEPPELVLRMFAALEADGCDVVLGARRARSDPLLSRAASTFFWAVYRRLVVKDIPPGGVDVFGCNRQFRARLLELGEARSSLVALIFWLGFRRTTIEYDRVARMEGRSAWTLRKKLDYLSDSVFAFTDLPIRLLINGGMLGIVVSVLLGAAVLASRVVGAIPVPGYATTVLLVLFFGALNMLGIGVVGAYAWRAYENTKGRPLAVVALAEEYVEGERRAAAPGEEPAYRIAT